MLAGLERAAIKRPVEREQLEALVDRIVAELRAQGGTPGVEQVGELALRGLRELDAVAYVRFASVYRKFEDVAEFERSWSGSNPSRRCSASTSSSRRGAPRGGAGRPVRPNPASGYAVTP